MRLLPRIKAVYQPFMR